MWEILRWLKKILNPMHCVPRTTPRRLKSMINTTFRTAIVVLSFAFATPGLAASTMHFSPLPLESREILIGTPEKAVRFRLQADCSGVSTVDTLTLVHEGGGKPAEIRELIVEDATGKKYPAPFRGFDDWTRTVTLRFADPIELKKCEAMDLTVSLNLHANAAKGRIHRLLIEMPTDILSQTSVVSGNAFPYRGPELKVKGTAESTEKCNGGTAKTRSICRKSRRGK